MAYSNSWSNIIPVSSDPLNTTDDQLRRLRLDVQERMDDLVDDWTADPVVPKTLAISRLTGTPQVARVWTGANFSLPSGAATVVDFIQETFDTGGFHDNSSNPSRLTVTDAGYYRIGTSLGLISGSTSAVGNIAIRKNGSLVAGYRRKHVGSSGTDGFAVQTIDLAAADDYYTVTLYQPSGDAWTTLDSENEAFFTIEKLIGTT